ncbi:MAG: hypothetical protein EBU21_12890 [Proteobacteria bacterium]|nr:hypothetical protein [Pseudomonadota bacterium]
MRLWKPIVQINVTAIYIINAISIPSCDRREHGPDLIHVKAATLMIPYFEHHSGGLGGASGIKHA